MKRRLIIYIGIILTVVMFGLHYLIRKYFSISSEYWDYKEPKTPYGVSTVVFDMKGRMKAMSFSPKGKVEIMGIKADDALEDVVRKLGKPKRIEKVKREVGDSGKKSVLVMVEYKRGKRGFIGLIFRDNRLETIFIKGGKTALPLGFKMGMNKEEVKKILGPPTKTDISESVVYPFGFLDRIIGCFWGVLLYSWIRRRKMHLNRFLLFFLPFLIFLFLFITIRCLIEVVYQIAVGDLRLFFQGFFSLLSRLLPLFLISSIFSGGIVTSLEYHSTSKKPKQTFLLILLIYLALSFIVSVFFQHHLGVELPYTLVPSLIQLAYDLFYFLLFPLFFYLFLPKEDFKFSIEQA